MTSHYPENENGQGTSQDPDTDTSPLQALVKQTRRLLRSTWVLTGLAATVGLALLLLVVTTMFDFVISSAIPSPWRMLRVLGLGLLVVPSIWALAQGVVRPLFRRLSAVLVARRIESELPSIHNRLVSCIDLSTNRDHVDVSPAFHRRLVSEALERIRGFDPRKVLDVRSLRRAGLVAAVGVVALSVIFIPGVTTAMARVFFPFSEIPPVGHATYSVEVGNEEQLLPGDGVVVRGDDVVFKLTLDGGALYADESLLLTIRTRNDDGETISMQHRLAAFDQQLSRLTLKGLEHDFDYRVTGGGTYTRSYHVEMQERPEIVNVGTLLTYPDYMVKLPRAGTVAEVEGPVGSEVTVKVVAEGDVEKGYIEFLEWQTKRETEADRPTRVWFESTRPVGSEASGTWHVENLKGREAHTDPPSAAVHAHGFQNAPEAFEVRVGDVLFADVLLPRDQMPRQVMLKWHDGKDWEHRAYWGEDLIAEGQPGTVSRHYVGPLPKSGRVVRLEVPASVVGLEGRSVKGMLFTLHGGQALWGASGTWPPAQREVRKLVATKKTFPLVQVTDTKSLGEWEPKLKPGQAAFSGVFPLEQNGLYRVQLSNKAQRFNKQMAEARVVAIPDVKPQVVIERPRQTLTLSTPQPVPVFVTAFDDFGVKDVVLSVRTQDQQEFQGEPVVTYAQPPQNVHEVVTLDLEQRGVKVGDTLIYRVEVRDGKGQSSQTIDYQIVVKDDSAAADKQFAQLEKQTDTFRDKFIELISQQEKVKAKVQELEEKYKPLSEKIEKAQAEAAEAEKTDPADPKADPKAKPEPKAPPKPVALSPEEQKQLDELKKQLAEVTAQENKNAALSEQVKTDLKNLAEQAQKNDLLPPQIAQQVKNLEQAFQEAAVDPLKQLAQQMQKAVDPKQQNTQLPQMAKKAERVQKDLETIQKRMDALARAQRDSREDLQQALDDLRKDLLEQNAELTRDALDDLKDYLAAMEKDLKNLMGKQENLLKDSRQQLSSEELKKQLEQMRKKLDKETDRELDEAAELLKAKRRDPRRPFFPNRPYKPEDEEYFVPPKERDTPAEPEDEKDKDAKKDKKDKKKAKKKDEDEEPEEEFFLPALGGLKPKLDPRFQKMLREIEQQLQQQKKKKKGENEEGEQERNRRQQVQRLEELDLAQKALQSDQQQLQDLQEQLEQSQQQSQQQQQQQSQQQQQDLAQLMQSMLLQKARQMMQRMQQQQQQQNQPQQKQQQPPQENLSKQLLGNLDPDGQGNQQVLVELEKVDVATRRVIMKMQPKEREELLQGLREEGPKGYRGFIRDYFQKLSRAREAKPAGK